MAAPPPQSGCAHGVDPSGILARLREAPIFGDDMPVFDAARAPEDPLVLFRDWILDAAKREVRAAQAFTLVTLAPDGAPDGRILVLRGVSARGWRFASSRESVKGRQLSADPRAAAIFHWPELGRQVRARGTVRESGEAAASREMARREFGARSPASKAEAVGGGLDGRFQSERLDDPAALTLALERAQVHVEAEPAWVPAFWNLFELVPDEVEFWQADRDRAHVRLLYRRTPSGFSHHRLWP